MDWNYPILYLAFFAPHLMFEHLHLWPSTPPNEETKREFNPMTISLGHLAEASPDVSSQMSDTLELLLSIRDTLSTLQLDSDGEVLDANTMQEDLAEDKGVQEVSQKSGFPHNV